MRKMTGMLVMVVVLGVVAVGPATAAAVGGSTSIADPADAGAPASVTAIIDNPAPIAPYEYSLQNRCWFSGRFNGHYDSSERFDLAGPWFLDGQDRRYTTAWVNLNDVPAGSVCRVTIMRGSSAVKGSTTSYDIV